MDVKKLDVKEIVESELPSTGISIYAAKKVFRGGRNNSRIIKKC
jgi:hypothetical protein